MIDLKIEALKLTTGPPIYFRNMPVLGTKKIGTPALGPYASQERPAVKKSSGANPINTESLFYDVLPGPSLER